MYNSKKREIENTPRKYENDKLILILSLYALAYFYSGWRVFTSGAVTVICAYIVKFLIRGFKEKTDDTKDILISSMVVAAVQPLSAPMWIFGLGGAILGLLNQIYTITWDRDDKLLSSNVDKNAVYAQKRHIGFSHINATIVILLVFFPTFTGLYPTRTEKLPIISNYSGVVSESVETRIIKYSSFQTISSTDVMFGKFTGGMASVYGALLVVGMIYMLFRRTISVSFFVTSGVIFILLLSLNPSGTTYIFTEIIVGNVLFAAIFCSSDPSIMPRSVKGRVVYGAFFAIIGYVFRVYTKEGGYIYYSIIFSSIMSSSGDKIAQKIEKLLLGIIRDPVKHLSSYESVKSSAMRGIYDDVTTQTVEIDIKEQDLKFNTPPIHGKAIPLKRGEAHKTSLKRIKVSRKTREVLRRFFYTDDQRVALPLPKRVKSNKAGANTSSLLLERAVEDECSAELIIDDVELIDIEVSEITKEFTAELNIGNEKIDPIGGLFEKRDEE